MTNEEKKIHDLKFELRQQRQRIDILEEHIKHIDGTINNILKTQLEEMQVVTMLTNSVAVLIKEREEKK